MRPLYRKIIMLLFAILYIICLSILVFNLSPIINLTTENTIIVTVICMSSSVVVHIMNKMKPPKDY